MPRLGLSVLPEDAELALSVADIVKQAGPQHLNCRIDLRDAGWEEALPRYRELARRLGAEVVLEIIIPGTESPAAEIGRAAAAVQAADLRPAAVVVTPAADLKSYPPGTPLPQGVPSWQEIIDATRAAFPGVRVGGGMLSNFTELNRKRPPGGAARFRDARHLDPDPRLRRPHGHGEPRDDRAHHPLDPSLHRRYRLSHRPRAHRQQLQPLRRGLHAKPGQPADHHGPDRAAPPRTVRRRLASRLLQRGRARRRRGGDHGLARRGVRHRLRQAAARPARPRRHAPAPRSIRCSTSSAASPQAAGARRIEAELERSRPAARARLAGRWPHAALAREPARGAA